MMLIAAFVLAVMMVIVLHVMALRRAVREHHELMALVWSENEEPRESGAA